MAPIGAVASTTKIPIPQDIDPFPFGKYGPKGQNLTYGEVPAKYLDWLDGQEWTTAWPAFKAYIDANRGYINQELEDAE